MNKTKPPPPTSLFHSLDPNTVLSLAEEYLGFFLSNLCRPLASYINRVYELEDEDRKGFIIKFYRPGRWSTTALQDEHVFLLELAEQEVPVIPPITMQSGKTLGTFKDIHFAIFPKCGGRSYDEYTEEQWLELGRLIGRTHTVGNRHLPKDRITLAPDKSTRDQVSSILEGNFIPADLNRQYEQLTNMLIEEITPMFSGVESIRLHGDCHFANLIYRPGESFYIIDFDDMAIAPPVQDFWMLLPNYSDKSGLEIELFLEGYETFRPFDRSTLRLIEPLRAMRYIYFSAWCAHQVAEDGQSIVEPEFGSHHYWQREIKDLADQLDRIRKADTINFGNA